jgi:hypothetical protein
MLHITLAALLVAASTSLATAQSSTATTGTLQPMTPSSNLMPNGQPKYQPPPAARSGEKGLRVGNDAAEAGPVEIRRKK